MHLTRATLKQDPQIAAVMPLLAQARGASHHLVWSLFADGPDRNRNFLFRETKDRILYILSERPPRESLLFDVASRPFDPVLTAGTRLSFTLRANPVVRKDGHKHDAVMHALRSIPAGEARRDARMRIAAEASEKWLRRLGEGGGFTLETCVLEGYRQERMPRRGGAPVQFGVVDLAGTLTVTEPDAFRARLRQGFGASRAWGCGLMLVRVI